MYGPHSLLVQCSQPVRDCTASAPRAPALGVTGAGRIDTAQDHHDPSPPESPEADISV